MQLVFGLNKDTFTPQVYQAGIDQLVLPSDKNSLEQGLAVVITTAQPATTHFRILRPDSELRWLQA